MSLCSAAWTALLVLPGSAAGAQQDTSDLRQQVEALNEQQSHVKSMGQVAIRPDGAKVAWSVDGPSESSSVIYLSSTTQAAIPTRITATNGARVCYENEPAWSHNGKQLAFLSDCASQGQAQLFVENFEGGPRNPRQLTHFQGFVSHLR